MYPFIRLTTTTAKSIYQTIKGDTLAITDTSTVHYRCNINDIDNFMEMNNGRILTLFDLGRTDFAIRTGLGKKLLAQRWGLVVAGSTVQYRKRIRLFNKVAIRTRLVAVDERWFYVEQVMMVNSKPCSHALLRTGVTNLKDGRVVETAKVLDALAMADFKLPPNDFVQAWIDADKMREFPTA